MPVSRKPLEYRPYLTVGTDSFNRISNAKCWHFDAWLNLSVTGALYLEIEQRTGGRVLRSRPMPRDYYRVLADGGLIPCAYYDVYEHAGRQLLISELDGLARLAALTAHWTYVIPWAARIPKGFTSSSVCCHYWPVPDVPAIPEGTINYCVKGGAVAGPIYYGERVPVPAPLQSLPDIFA